MLQFTCAFNGIYLREKRLWQTLHSYGRSLVSVLYVRLLLQGFDVTDATAHASYNVRFF